MSLSSPTHPLWNCAEAARARRPADLTVPVREYWSRAPEAWAGDARGGITMGHLLEMRPNLQFVEDYNNGGVSDVIQMLNSEDEMGIFTANKPPVNSKTGPAGFNYSSGTTNIVCDILTTALSPEGSADQRKAAFLAFFEAELCEKIGCGGRLSPKFDNSGTIVGSSWVYGAARDFARLPFLYMKDGVWDGVRLLPEGWAEYARTISGANDADGNNLPPPYAEGIPGYGAHWWTDTFAGYGVAPDIRTFSCNGYEGQFSIAIPAHNMVRLLTVLSSGSPTLYRGSLLLHII